MAITEVRQTGVESTGRVKDADGKVMLTLTVQYEAISDDASDNTYDAESSILLPALGASHPQNFYLTVRERNATRESPLYFLIDVIYSTDKTDEDNQDPIDTAAVVRWSTVREELEADEDIDGNPLATVLGEPIRGLTRHVSDSVATITKPFLTFDSFSFNQFKDHVNSDNFLGWPPGTALVEDISADPVRTSEFQYWSITVQVRFRLPLRPDVPIDRSWWKRVRHEGYYVNGGGGGDDPRVRAVDANREPTAQPVLLDADGYQINYTNGEPDDPPYWLMFEMQPSTAFSAMNLGV